MLRRSDGKPRVALLVTDGFEQSELTAPRDALRAADMVPVILSLDGGSVRAWQHTDWGDTIVANDSVEATEPDDFEALVLPGGVMNPDKLRVHPRAREFVRGFFEQDKPVAAICHGPWTLIDIDQASGRRMTSYHSIRRDLENAGAEWVDAPVVVDGNLITSRDPSDLDQFCAKLIELVRAGSPA